MSENPSGIMVMRDELSGWLSQLDRPGREGERAFCLQAWNGDTGHTIDRIWGAALSTWTSVLHVDVGWHPARAGSDPI